MMQHHPRMVYTAIAVVIALVIATAIILFFPEADECPEGKIAKFSWFQWECSDLKE
jgi:hypothetical protein